MSSVKVPSKMRKCADSDHLAHTQSIILAFSLYSYGLKYPMILLADSEGPDQSVWMRRLTWDFVIRICPETRFGRRDPLIKYTLMDLCSLCSFEPWLSISYKIACIASEDSDQSASAQSESSLMFSMDS